MTWFELKANELINSRNAQTDRLLVLCEFPSGGESMEQEKWSGSSRPWTVR